MLVGQTFFSIKNKALKLLLQNRDVGISVPLWPFSVRFATNRWRKKWAELQKVMYDDTRASGLAFFLSVIRWQSPVMLSPNLGCGTGFRKSVDLAADGDMYQLMSSWCGLRYILADLVFFFPPLVSCVGWMFRKVFLACSVSGSRVWSQVFIFSWDIQLTYVHHWMCLSFDLMFLAFYLSTMIRLLFEWSPSLLCCTWQFPISLHFWFMDTTAIKFGTG